jgi:hypothetical protein
MRESTEGSLEVRDALLEAKDATLRAGGERAPEGVG